MPHFCVQQFANGDWRMMTVPVLRRHCASRASNRVQPAATHTCSRHGHTAHETGLVNAPRGLEVLAARGSQTPALMEIFSEPYGLDKAKRYEIIRTVGRGAFGEVFLAWDTQTKQPEAPPLRAGGLRDAGMGEEGGGGYVALKTVASGVSSSSKSSGGGGGLSKGLFRELRALQMATECPHIVTMLDVYPEGSNAVLVLEYMPSDLAKVLDGSPNPLEESHIKAYTAMLLKGLAWMHAHGLLHRDIKPSNLLLSAGGVLKIADFGQTRTHTIPQTRSYSHQVATRWYRAPELLYGARRYGFAVDMWAAGAVVGEMLAGRPLFPGRSDIDQLYKILQVTGSPTDESWPGVKDLPDYDKVCFAEMPPQDASVTFQGSSREACDLTQGMLRLDPRNRTPALEALQHSYFLVAPEATPCHLLLPRIADSSFQPQRPQKLGEAFLDEGWGEGVHADGDDATGAV